MGLLCKHLSLSRQLLVKGTDGLQVWSSLLIFDLLALTKLSDHPLTRHTPILKGLHERQHLKQSMTIKIKRK